MQIRIHPRYSPPSSVSNNFICVIVDNLLLLLTVGRPQVQGVATGWAEVDVPTHAILRGVVPDTDANPISFVGVGIDHVWRLELNSPICKIRRMRRICC